MGIKIGKPESDNYIKLGTKNGRFTLLGRTIHWVWYEAWQSVWKVVLTNRSLSLDLGRLAVFMCWSPIDWRKEQAEERARIRCQDCFCLTSKKNKWWCDDANCRISKVKNCRNWSGNRGQI